MDQGPYPQCRSQIELRIDLVRTPQFLGQGPQLASQIYLQARLIVPIRHSCTLPFVAMDETDDPRYVWDENEDTG